jgi:GGDEF domain-containing protein
MRSFEKLKVAQSELQILDSTDPLTELFNCRYFGNAAARISYKNRKARQATAIAIIDIRMFWFDTVAKNLLF